MSDVASSASESSAAPKQLSRRWRKLERQPTGFLHWPEEADRAVEYAADPILVYDNCNGYSLWHEFDEHAPPAEWWIALPKREHLPRREED